MPLHARLRASVRGVAAVGVGAVLCALAAPAAAAAATAPRTPVSSAAHHVAGDYVLGPSTAPAASGVLAPAKLRAAVVPASVDLRAKAPAVGDQGQLSDCAAWTIGYAIMGYYANAKAGQGAPYAPLYLYQQSLRAPSTAPNGGTSGYAVLTEAQTNGVDTQADYTQGLYDWHTLPTAAQKANAAAYKVTGWAHLFQGGNQGAKAQQLIQQALAAGTPVALGLEVFDNFGTLGPNQVYSATTGRDLGGHMVTAFGYTAAGVIVRNSWGIDWGTNGDAILSWSYVAKYGIDAYSVSGISTPALTQATPPAGTPPPAAGDATPQAAPTVTSLSPKTGFTTIGTKVTITGTGLSRATKVLAGGKPVPFGQLSGTAVWAVLPPHTAGIVDVQVVTSAGTSPASVSDRFSYVPTPAPVIGRLSKTSAPARTRWTTVDVIGSGFNGTTKATSGGAAVKFTVLSNTVVRIVLPAHRIGKVTVTLVTPAGSTAKTAAAVFTYRAR